MSQRSLMMLLRRAGAQHYVVRVWPQKLSTFIGSQMNALSAVPRRYFSSLAYDENGQLPRVQQTAAAGREGGLARRETNRRTTSVERRVVHFQRGSSAFSGRHQCQAVLRERAAAESGQRPSSQFIVRPRQARAATACSPPPTTVRFGAAVRGGGRSSGSCAHAARSGPRAVAQTTAGAPKSRRRPTTRCWRGLTPFLTHPFSELW